jgi:hypothetical protein
LHVAAVCAGAATVGADLIGDVNGTGEGPRIGAGIEWEKLEGVIVGVLDGTAIVVGLGFGRIGDTDGTCVGSIEGLDEGSLCGVFVGLFVGERLG